MCSTYYETTGISGFLTSNEWMIVHNELGNDVEERDHGLIEVLSRHLPG
jgi:hypothetical protein